MNIGLSQQQACDTTREWLQTNGLGGYASSTVGGVNTRKYHGLLVANLPPPARGRHVLLSRFEETLILNGVEHILAPCRAVAGEPGRGVEFALDLCAQRVCHVAGATVTIATLMSAGRDAVLLRYELAGASGSAATLRLCPCLAYRRHHGLMRAHPFIDTTAAIGPGGIRLHPYAGMPPLHIQHSVASADATFTAAPAWIQGVEYPVERERGYPWIEDLFAPGAFEIVLRPGVPVWISAATEPVTDPPGLWHDELARRRAERTADAAHIPDTLPPTLRASAAWLLAAARQFVVTVPPGRLTAVAGYHWFDDWGRDAFIALPGLTFWSGRLDEGFEVLAGFAAYERGGLLPNFIGMEAEPAYNSVDAALWFFWAVQQYIARGGRHAAVRARLWPCMKAILSGIVAAPGLRLTPEGLLSAGTPDTHLTWMDAVASGGPVTPRWGCAVEINALWYNALAFSCALAETFGDDAFLPPAPPRRVAAAFRTAFWLPATGGLADVVNRDGVDDAVRPNQIFAVSLPYSPLTRRMQSAVVRHVAATLLTPYGLRTLASTHPAYRGRYEGDQDTRDRAYHQGTVWPWLLGAFGDAYLRVHGRGARAKAFLVDAMQPWAAHLHEAGLGTVSEVFDGDAPQRPNGCIAQAWSVAELLRLHLQLG